MREQQQDAERKEKWQQWAREIAQRLVTEHQVGGVGLIGSLLSDHPSTDGLRFI